MNCRRICLGIVLVVLLAGCGTRYVYYGFLEAENSLGEEREHVIYWTKTERPLWFDECSGSVTLLTECSFEAIAFDETDDGIIFRCPPDHTGVTRTVEVGEPCGEILDSNRIGELAEGKLRLVIYCVYEYGDFSEGDHSYLKARDEFYEFDIKRAKSSKFEGGAPKPRECQE